MMICDVISRLKTQVFATQTKIRELEKKRESLRGAKVYCGKCQNGIVYRGWPKMISDSWGVDFAKAMREMMPNGYPDDCDCIGGGKYAEEAHRLDDAVKDVREEIEKWQKRRAQLEAKVGSRIIDKGLHNFIRTGNENEVKKLERWSSNHMRSNLIFVGESGSGKSHLASGITNQLTCDERDFIYIDGFAIDKLNTLEAIDSGARERSIERMSDTDFLIIDDAGKSKMTQALFSHVWFPIIKSRYDNSLVTIFTFDKIVRKTWRDSGVDSDSLNALYNRIEAMETSVPQAEFILLERYIADSVGNDMAANTQKRERADIYG